MKITFNITFILFAFVAIIPLPNSFAQHETPPENTVGVIYFLPSDRAPHKNVNDKLDTLLKTVQKFFEDEMNRNGFGKKTFKLQTDTNGKTVVHHVNGKFNAEYYNAQPGAFSKIYTEISHTIDMARNIYFIAADVTFPSASWRGGGQSLLGSHTITYIPYDQDFIDLYFAGHELAHSFGLQHDFRWLTDYSEADILSYTVGIDFNNRRLSKCAAEWLDVHPYFNDTQPSINEPVAIEMLPPLEYPPNAISLRFDVTDPNGLHQAQLVIPRESGFSLNSCKSLDGEKHSIVEFITTELTATANNTVALGIIDVQGNFSWTSYTIPVDDIRSVDGVINVDSSAAATVRIVSGSKQSGYLNSRLINPFVVTVRDADDAPVAGVQVAFEVVAGTGTLSVTNPWTDSEGQAQTYLTLGSARTAYRVAASVAGVSEPAIFSASVNITTVPTAMPFKTLRGHRDTVFGLAYSPDGSLIATASRDTTIRLWDGRTAEYKKTLRGHTGEVDTVAFSPDGLTLVSGSSDDTIRLWDVATGTTKLQFNGLSYSIPVVAYFPDGSKIASGTLEGEIHVWDALTGQHITSYTGHVNGNVSSIDFNPDGSILASGGSDRIIRLWDTTTGRQIRTIDKHVPPYGDSVRIVFNSDGSKLASVGAWDRTARIWDVDTGQQLQLFSEHATGDYAVAFSRDDRTLATGSFSGEIRLWDTTTGLLQKLLIGHTDTVRTITFSPNQNILVSAGHDHTVNLWEFTPTFTDSDIDVSNKVVISEIMVATNQDSLPQWIELQNFSDSDVAILNGWKLLIQNHRTKDFNENLNVELTLGERTIDPLKTLLIVTKQGRSSQNFSDEQIYNVSELHPDVKGILLNEEGFYMKLSNVEGELIDEVGNMDDNSNFDDKPTWLLPKRFTESGARTSMVRRHDMDVPRSGTNASGWVSAKNTKLLTNTTSYYGHPQDIGAPGIERGGALPVTLSHFRASHTDASVVLNWTTESEVDNAGFYIYRSKTKNGEFKIVTPTMIQGAGTTGERNEYTWTDTTAKLNTVYYYRIEDISYTGEREQLATVRLRGFVSASGKLTTRWANLKVQ